MKHVSLSLLYIQWLFCYPQAFPRFARIKRHVKRKTRSSIESLELRSTLSIQAYSCIQESSKYRAHPPARRRTFLLYQKWILWHVANSNILSRAFWRCSVDSSYQVRLRKSQFRLVTEANLGRKSYQLLSTKNSEADIWKHWLLANPKQRSCCDPQTYWRVI